jgi:hypothetical protein
MRPAAACPATKAAIRSARGRFLDAGADVKF